MKNTGQIVRKKKSGGSGYTCISNEILQSQILKPDEKSVLVHLLSLPEDWVVYKTTIWKKMNIGRDRFYKAWDGLVKLGYIVASKIIDKNSNLIIGYNYIVYEEPVKLISDLLVSGITENQISGNPVSIQSNNKQRKKIQNGGPGIENDTGPDNIIGINTGPASGPKSENLNNNGISTEKSKNKIIEFENASSCSNTTAVENQEISTNSTQQDKKISPIGEMREAMAEWFYDYPNWESDLYRLGLDSFIWKTAKKYGTGDPESIDIIKYFLRL